MTNKRMYFIFGLNLIIAITFLFMWVTLIIYGSAGITTWAERIVEAPLFILLALITVIIDIKEMRKYLNG